MPDRTTVPESMFTSFVPHFRETKSAAVTSQNVPRQWQFHVAPAMPVL